MSWLRSLVLVPLLTACPKSIIPDYEAARAEALAEPGPAPTGWTPDAALTLSNNLIDTLITTALAEQGALAAISAEDPRRSVPTWRSGACAWAPPRAATRAYRCPSRSEERWASRWAQPRPRLRSS